MSHIDDFNKWMAEYRRWLLTPLDGAARIRFKLFVAGLRPVLKALSVAAQEGGEDPGPALELLGNLDAMPDDIRRFEAALDMVWLLVRRLDLAEVVKNKRLETDRETDNRQENRNISDDAQSIARALIKAKKSGKSTTQKAEIQRYIERFPRKCLSESSLEKQVRMAVRRLRDKPDK